MTSAKKSEPERVLILRSVRADGVSYNGWKYPLNVGAEIECPDWNDRPVCGGGFHGLEFGEGSVGLLNWDFDAHWQVWECDRADVVKITDDNAIKSKFRRGKLVFSQQGMSPGYPLAFAYIEANDPRPKPAKAKNIASGDSSSAASSGTSSSAASSGTSSSAEAAGAETCAMVAGIGGRARAGERGAFALAWKDGDRIRIAVGIVGENGIKADTWYSVGAGGALVEVAS